MLVCSLRHLCNGSDNKKNGWKCYLILPKIWSLVLQVEVMWFIYDLSLLNKTININVEGFSSTSTFLQADSAITSIHSKELNVELKMQEL